MTIVLVHGSWHGAWCWRLVAPRLQAAGWRVEMPALTGLGERGHLLNRGTGLGVHVADIVNLLTFGDLRGAVLVGHSYGGMVVTEAAARVPERVGALVYLDGYVPEPGECELDFWTQEEAREVREGLTRGVAFLPPPDPSVFGVTDPALRRWMADRLTPHPALSYVQRAARGLRGPLFDRIPRTFVLSAEGVTAARFQPIAARGREEGWRVDRLRTGHDSMLTAPEETASCILRAAADRVVG